MNEPIYPAPGSKMQWQEPQPGEVSTHGNYFEEDFESAFYTALALAQAAFKPIHRTRTVQVAMRTGGSYTFAYAPLETILAATVPALAAQGISIHQRIRIDTSFEEPIHYLVTTLRKGRYETFNEVMVFKTDATAQAYGSAVTYARRMGVTLLLCVAADDDNDGSDTQLKAPPVQRATNPSPSGQGTYEAKGGAGMGAQDQAHHEDPELSESQRADLDIVLNDSTGEMLDACAEGRRVGIQQIWNEMRSLKHGDWLQAKLWGRIKREYPDHFKTMRDTLKPASTKGPRGPKPADDSVPA